ncbi:MAG: hypothetical protein GY953_31905 [bacterium]|nr:hypothetical protein [bacterium]
MVYSALGDVDASSQWFVTAYQDRDPMLVTPKAAPIFDPYRSDPRFQDLLKRMNFPE